MAESTNVMMDYLSELLPTNAPDSDKTKKVFHREQVLDVMQKEIVEFLSELLSGNVSHDVMNAARMHLRMADEYESVSDYVSDVLKLHLKLQTNNVTLDKDDREEILSLHEEIKQYLAMINQAVI